ncbi:MAG: hypothetical protein EOO01_04955, partial [Chitinophagaceae bacterium]
MKSVPVTTLKSFLFVTAFVLFTACSKDEESDNGKKMIVIAATGDINSKLDEFRQLLGSQVN